MRGPRFSVPASSSRLAKNRAIEGASRDGAISMDRQGRHRASVSRKDSLTRHDHPQMRRRVPSGTFAASVASPPVPLAVAGRGAPLASFFSHRKGASEMNLMHHRPLPSFGVL
eukprot:scaffold169266_cov29-Tisochrysis_lutea.AAC.4